MIPCWELAFNDSIQIIWRTHASLFAPTYPPSPMEIAPAANSARPPRTTTLVFPNAERPALSAKGTVRPSERPRIESETMRGLMRDLELLVLVASSSSREAESLKVSYRASRSRLKYPSLMVSSSSGERSGLPFDGQLDHGHGHKQCVQLGSYSPDPFDDFHRRSLDGKTICFRNASTILPTQSDRKSSWSWRKLMLRPGLDQ